MKRAYLGGVVAVAVALLLVSVAPPVSAATAMPTWSAGDYWVYTLSGNGGGAIPSLGSGGTLRYDVVGTDSTSVGSSTFSTYRTRVNVTMQLSVGSSKLNLSLSGDEWFRTSDLAPAKLTLGATILGVTLSMTAAYNPPPDLHWPLTSGASWSVTTNISLAYTFFGQSNSTHTNEVAAQSVMADQTISVAAGTFTATPVKLTVGTSSDYSVSYWSSTAGNSVSQRSYNRSGAQTGSADLKAYSYQGGGFLSTLILGIPLWTWLIVVAVVVIAAVAVLVLRRKKPVGPQGMPLAQPHMQPGAPGGPGQPPMGPPQQPPGPPPR